MKRNPNSSLRALITHAQWTNDGLARAVNAVAAEAGQKLNYDRTSVAHWLSGSRPRGDVPSFLAEAFARKLGRPVTPADLGFGVSTAPHVTDNVFDVHDAAGYLTRLARADLDTVGHTRLRNMMYRVSDVIVPAWSDPIVRQLRSTSRTNRPSPAPALGGISAVIDAFGAVDRSFGGGHARVALVAYLGHDVAHLLRTANGGATHAALWDAAAQCAHLAGFMCFDSHHHGLAIRYFRTALRLSAQAGTPDTYSAVLRDMSLQTWTLGHLSEAVRLAETAVASANDASLDRTRATALGQLAVAQAAVAGHHEAQSTLQLAEETLNKSADNGAGRHDQSADLAFRRSLVLEYAGDLRGAIQAASASLRYRPSSERRSRAITNARLADRYLRAGRMNQAGEAIDELLGDHAELRSARVDAALLELQRRLKPHRKHPLLSTRLQAIATRLGSIATERRDQVDVNANRA